MIKFSEMPYQRPDFEETKKFIEEATAKAAGAKSYQEVRDAFFAVQEKSDKATTEMAIANVRSTMDTTDEYYDKEVNWLNEQVAMLTEPATAWNKTLAASPFRKDIEAFVQDAEQFDDLTMLCLEYKGPQNQAE